MSCIIAVHLLATDCVVTTSVIIIPYKIVYFDSKLVIATMHGCNYSCKMKSILKSARQWCSEERVQIQPEAPSFLSFVPVGGGGSTVVGNQ